LDYDTKGGTLMPRAVTAILAVLTLASISVRGAPDDAKKTAEAKDKKPPKAQFQAVLDEYQNAQRDFSQAYSKAKTDEERSKLFTDKYPKPNDYADRFMAIADGAPGDPAAVDALVWCVQLGNGGKNALKAMERLAQKHADDAKVGPAVAGIAYSYAPVAETLLRAITEKNRDRTARGSALLALAQYLNRRVELIRALNQNDKRQSQYEQFLTAQGYDKDAIARLKTADPAALVTEAQTLFEKVEKEFADINNGRGTLGKIAAGELNELRNLGIGKPSPEISGTDIDGKSFKLSDYRGNVVVVDFWGDW
jgi:hypothetical protein